jgi:hypothetical protein
MSSGYEPVLHALAVEPAIARPGDTVRLTFRTRNVGTLTSPAGTVEFALPAGIEALGEAEVLLPSVEPGEAAVAAICARVALPFDDRTELPLQAALVLADARLATNVCVLRVRSRAVLDGDASGTFVERVDTDTVRVRAVVTNQGDGPALCVRVRLPPPAGCRRLDGDEVATLDADRLEPGESIALGFDARVEHVLTSALADTGEVRWGNGNCRALPVRGGVSLRPVIAPPLLATRPFRRCVEVTADLRNDGWAHAHDVCASIDLPPGLRLAEGSIAVGGVPLAVTRARRGAPPVARLQRRGGAYALTIALLPARSTVGIRFTAHHAGEFPGGTLGVRVDGHAAEATFRTVHHRDVRVEPFDVPAGVAPGSTVTIRARIVNAGNRSEEVDVVLLRAGGVEAAPMRRTVESGCYAVVGLSFTAGTAVDDGTPLPLALVVSDAEGELARAELALTVRAPVIATPEPDDAHAELVRPELHAALHAPDEIVAGTPLAVRLDVDVDDALDRLTVRVPELAVARYVAGSTSVGGCALLDGVAGSPLHGSGLVLRAIPAATRVSIGWSVLVERDAVDSIGVCAELDGDERNYELTPLAVRVRRAGTFATRPAELAYHVDACALPPAIVQNQPAPPQENEQHRIAERDESESTADNDESQPIATAPAAPRPPCWDEVARLLHGARCGGLVVHVLALRALFPESGDETPTSASHAELDEAGHALRDMFDRLFVKLRIPGFVVAADDLEDRRLREAILALTDACDAELGRAALANAPLGAPVALRALRAAIPAPSRGAPVDASARAYLHAIEGMLASYEDLPLAVFDEALARGRDAALDEARAVLLAAIDQHLATRAVAC